MKKKRSVTYPLQNGALAPLLVEGTRLPGGQHPVPPRGGGAAPRPPEVSRQGGAGAHQSPAPAPLGGALEPPGQGGRARGLPPRGVASPPKALGAPGGDEPQPEAGVPPGPLAPLQSGPLGGGRGPGRELEGGPVGGYAGRGRGVGDGVQGVRGDHVHVGVQHGTGSGVRSRVTVPPSSRGGWVASL